MNDIEFLYDIVHMHSLLLQQHKTSVPLHHLPYLHMTLFIMLNLCNGDKEGAQGRSSYRTRCYHALDIECV